MARISQVLPGPNDTVGVIELWVLIARWLKFAKYLPNTRTERRLRNDTQSPLHFIPRWAIFVCLAGSTTHAATYYISPSGSNLNTGTNSTSAWQNIDKVNATKFAAGDSILFEGGSTFGGRIYLDAADTGTADKPITISSYGTGRATIDGAQSNALYAYNTAGLNIANLNFIGAGASTNTGCAIVCYCDLSGDVKLNHLYIDNVEISGFQYGIRIGGKNGASGYNDVRITRALVHDNQREAVRLSGFANYAITNLYVGHCEFFNNFGDPLLTTNTGSGLVLGQVDGAVVERCLAHDNGEFCTAIEGGSGIWCHDSNNVIIQHNESWNNHTAGINDGGGFDLDGATTNSILQYNYSHDNDGAGFGLYQYAGAGTWSKNIVRFNISQNDGRKNGFAGILVANKSSAISDCEIYNNTVFMSPASNGAPRAAWILTATTNFHFRNNAFTTTGGVPVVDITGDQAGWEFQGNLYWPTDGPLNIVWNGLTFNDLNSWRAYTGQETMFSDQLGIVADPLMTNAGLAPAISNADSLESLNAYALQDGSPLVNAGINLTEKFGIDSGPRDFFGNPLPLDGKLDVGAFKFPNAAAGGTTPKAPQILSITSLKAGLASSKGRVTFSATFVSVSQEVFSQSFIADVAGASGTFTFDAKGHASTPQGSASLKWKRIKNQAAKPTITVNLVGDWTQIWTQRQIIPGADAKDRVDVPISFLFGNNVYATVLNASRISRKGKLKITK